MRSISSSVGSLPSTPAARLIISLPLNSPSLIAIEVAPHLPQVEIICIVRLHDVVHVS